MSETIALSSSSSGVPAREGSNAPPDRSRPGSLSITYLAATAVLVAVYHLTRSELVRPLMYELVGASSVAAVAIGIHRYRPRRARAWWLLAIGTAGWVVGDVIWDWYPQIAGRPLPEASVADAVYVISYPVLFIGLVLLVRNRRAPGSWGRRIDAATPAIAGAWLLWTFVIQHYGHIAGIADLVNVSYPVMDILLIGVAARFVMAPGHRSIAFRLLALSLTVVFAADVIYARIAVVGPMSLYGYIANGWLFGYVTLGMAALHPSMAGVGELDPSAVERMTVARFGLLISIGATPILSYVVAPLFGLRMSGAAVAAATAPMFMLGGLRVGGWLVQMDSQAERLRASQHERGLLLHRITTSAERERLRLSAELHDGPVQHLTAMSYQLQRAEMRLAQGDVDTTRRLLSDLNDAFPAEIVALRKMMSELRPPILRERGLEAALRDYVAERQKDARAAISLIVVDVAEMDEDVETTLFRIAQEGISNAIRHSGATRIDVMLESDDVAHRLSISDDGCGFDPEGESERGHFGLMAMRERAVMQGGTFEIGSASPHGTTVTATIPRLLRAA